MSAPRFVRLKPEEDASLREVEQDPYLKPKARLRAQVLRLSSRGESVKRIAFYTGRSPTSICRDFDRWEQRGLEGLAAGGLRPNELSRSPCERSDTRVILHRSNSQATSYRWNRALRAARRS